MRWGHVVLVNVDILKIRAPMRFDLFLTVRLYRPRSRFPIIEIGPRKFAEEALLLRS